MNMTTDAQRAAAQPLPALVGASCGTATGAPAGIRNRTTFAPLAMWPMGSPMGSKGGFGLGTVDPANAAVTGIAMADPGEGDATGTRPRPLTNGRTFPRRFGSIST